MQFLLPIVVFLLMVSIGMSLQWRELLTNWSKFPPTGWFRLLIATFLLPPACALLLVRLFGLSGPDTIGLYLVAVIPGAPLLARSASARGFDMQLAASYQIWCALMVPLMVPFTVWAGAALYGRDIWIAPSDLLAQIATKQLLPLLCGMAAARLAPDLCSRIAKPLGTLGGLALYAIILAFLIKMTPQLIGMSLRTPLAAVLLSIAALLSVLALFPTVTPRSATIATCNVNRHVGLALLMSGNYFHTRAALPALAAYAIAVPIVLLVYGRFFYRPSPGPSRPA